MEVAEVILVTQNEDIDGASTIIHTCLSLDDANSILDDISFVNLDDENCRVYRGILTSADAIPSKFLGCTPYIIVQLPNREYIDSDCIDAHFEKAPMSPDKVQTRIQELLSEELVFEDGDGIEIAGIPTIDDIYLFFGVKLQFVFKIADQGVDEEFEDRLASLSKNISDTGKAIKTLTEIEVKEDLSNMNKEVALHITLKTGETYRIEGRLLGGAVTEEAIKIAQNYEIAERAHTGATQPMNAVVPYLSNIETGNQKIAANLRTHGHFIVTLEAIKYYSDSIHTEVHSRQLYISPPISLTREFVDNATSTAATFECTDGTTIYMTEYKTKEVVND